MSVARSWPERFRVTLLASQGVATAYTVVTWLTEFKAVALAVETHLRRHGERALIFDVSVEDLGPAPRDTEGAMHIPGGDLIDRLEF